MSDAWKIAVFAVIFTALCGTASHFTKVRIWVYFFVLAAVVTVVVLISKGYS